MAESFFATLKGDLVDYAVFATRAGARVAIFEYVEVFYDRQRRHAHLGDQTPVAFEEEAGSSIRAAA